MSRFIIKIIFVLVASLFVVLPTNAFAQDSNGNYYKEYLPYEDGGNYVVGTWHVIAPSGLNCRSGAGTEFEVVTTFGMGDKIHPKTSEGRDQHNNPTELDKQGLPWFRIIRDDGKRRSTKNIETCLVRANSRYITPLKES